MLRNDTLTFLSELAQNNSREWFQDHKDEYEKAHANVVDIAADLISALSQFDPDVDAATDPKKCVMRIYRDVRFSKDKTPYKTNLSIGRLTRSRAAATGYFLQIEPGKSFIAGGYWMPEAEHLKAIRQEIDYNAADLKAIIDASDFKKLFGEFRDQEKLKTLPKGYEAGNENIDLLKLKSFIAYRDLQDEELLSANAVKMIAGLCKKIHPLNIFLKNALQ